MNRLVREELRFQAGFPGPAGDPGGRLGEVRERLRALTQLGDRPGHICIPKPTSSQGTGTNYAPLRLPVQPEQNAGQPRNWLGCRPHQPEIKQDPPFGTAAPLPPMLDPVVHERVIWVRSAR
jgi:hypothetical protein